MPYSQSETAVVCKADPPGVTSYSFAMPHPTGTKGFSSRSASATWSKATPRARRSHSESRGHSTVSKRCAQRSTKQQCLCHSLVNSNDMRLSSQLATCHTTRNRCERLRVSVRTHSEQRKCAWGRGGLKKGGGHLKPLIYDLCLKSSECVPNRW